MGNVIEKTTDFVNSQIPTADEYDMMLVELEDKITQKGMTGGFEKRQLNLSFR